MPSLPEQAPGAGLTLAQRKFCQLMVTTTTLTDTDLSRMVGAPEASIRLWRKNKHCKAYIEALTSEVVSDRTFMERAKQTTYRLYDKMAVEVESRFEQPDMSFYNTLPDAFSRQAYLDRFAGNAAFKDIVRAFEAINKSTRLMMPTEVESETVVSFQDMNARIRQSYEVTLKERMEWEKRLMTGAAQAEADPVGELFSYKNQMALREKGEESLKAKQRLGAPDAILPAADEDATEDLLEVTIKSKTTTRNQK